MKFPMFCLTTIVLNLVAARVDAQPTSPEANPTTIARASQVDLRGVVKWNGKVVSRPRLITALGKSAMLGLNFPTGYKYELRLTPTETPLPNGETGIYIDFILLESANGSPLREISRQSAHLRYDEAIEGIQSTPSGELYLQLTASRVP